MDSTHARTRDSLTPSRPVAAAVGHHSGFVSISGPDWGRGGGAASTGGPAPTALLASCPWAGSPVRSAPREIERTGGGSCDDDGVRRGATKGALLWLSTLALSLMSDL